ncbi:hypothetical protein [Terrabacter terrigena]|uniref:Uncharacterized protein n=1 Tax=Terrabacter terrigena TaxID=574718 RepID=A0ABW3N2R1_9MICO
MATGTSTDEKRNLLLADAAYPFSGECRFRHPWAVRRHPHCDLADVHPA